MAPTPESAAFLAKKPVVPPTFDGVDYDDTKRLKQAQDAIIREQWVRTMMARLVREELGKCYFREGVNHLEKCGALRVKIKSKLTMTYTYHFLKRPIVNLSHLAKLKFRTTLNTKLNPSPVIYVFSTTAFSFQPSDGTTVEKQSWLTGAEHHDLNLPESISPAGTVLRGLNYVKGRDDPISLKEEEYPPWLWGLLDKKNTDSSSSNDESDLFSKSKKLRRKAAKKQRKLEALKEASGKFEEVKVPLTQQSIDLPSNEEGTLIGATNAEEARRELRIAMRSERKKKIKEKNYLR
ncbi:hypothetical protein EPUL_001837, partial [Erysiphe pulchra]